MLELVAEAQRRRWTACQYAIVQNRDGARPDAKHRRRYHVSSPIAYWLVLRNGPSCHGPGRRLKHELVCEACGEPFYARRADARTCGGRCRSTLRRRRRTQ